jgi:hypothetical protein
VALGLRLDPELPFSFLGSPPAAALVGGSLAPTGLTDPRGFRVGLFNTGEERVRVRVVGLDGWPTEVVATHSVDIAPHSWGQAVFTLPQECEGPAPPEVTAMRVRTGGPGRPAEQLVELAEPAGALRDHHDLECPAPVSLDSAQLTGLWIVEEARGRWEGFAHKGLMRFTPDRRFAFDPEGRMFDEGKQGFFGTYRLHGSRLHLRSDGGYACGVGYAEVWTTTLLSEDRLRLDIVRSDSGYCRSPPGERQILRRLLPVDGLPAEEPTSAR